MLPPVMLWTARTETFWPSNCNFSAACLTCSKLIFPLILPPVIHYGNVIYLITLLVTVTCSPSFVNPYETPRSPVAVTCGGTSSLARTKARTSLNPQTGDTIKVKSRRNRATLCRQATQRISVGLSTAQKSG